jgi:hypothetical protein
LPSLWYDCGILTTWLVGHNNGWESLSYESYETARVKCNILSSCGAGNEWGRCLTRATNEHEHCKQPCSVGSCLWCIQIKNEGSERGRTRETGNSNFQEMLPISNRQLVSGLAGAHCGNLCFISFSHHLKLVCSSDVMHDCNF